MSGTWPTKSSNPNKNEKKGTIPTTSTSAGDLQKVRKSPIKYTDRDELLKGKEQFNDDDDIIDLIRIIDGEANDRYKEAVLEQSLLSSIDKYAKSGRTECLGNSDSVCIDMDVDDVHSEKQTGGPKRKISDYFVKVTK